MATQEHIMDLLPAYALGVLDEPERAQIKEHLVSCAACQQSLESFLQTADHLALAMPEHSPRPELKQRLMDRTKPKSLQEHTITALPKVTWSQRLRSLLSHPVWQPVALLFILGLAGLNLLLLRQVNDLKQVLGNVDESYVVALEGTEADPDAVGKLFITADGEHATLVVNGLSALDSAQQYQLWLIEGDQPVGALVFSVDSEGEASALLAREETLLSYSAFAVSIEPFGGSLSPTGAIVLMGGF